MTNAVVVSQAQMLQHIWRDPSAVVVKDQHTPHYEVSFPKTHRTLQVVVAEPLQEAHGRV